MGSDAAGNARKGGSRPRGSRWAAVGALAALLGVVAGAFGAHALKDRLVPENLAVFEVAVRYQLYHALALVLVGGLLAQASPGSRKKLAAAGWCFLLGIVVFSGSLYALVLTGVKGLGAVTPLGGLAFLVGWAVLAASFLLSRTIETAE